MKSRLFGKSGSLFKEAAILMIEAPRDLIVFLKSQNQQSVELFLVSILLANAIQLLLIQLLNLFRNVFFFFSYFAYPSSDEL